MAKIRTTVTVGAMEGRMMCQMRLMRPAPSIIAASYSVGSTLVIAARKMIAHQPISFQMPVPTASCQK